MPGAGAARRGPAVWRLPALLSGMVLGAALQLQQPDLWPPAVYAALLCAALALGWCAHAAPRWQRVQRWRARHTGARRARLLAAAPGALTLLAAALALFAFAGWRASAYQGQALAAALEGQDIRVTALIAAMPQPHARGLRLRLAVRSASLRGAPVALPPRIDVSWYRTARPAAAAAPAGAGADGLPAALRAGQLWDLTVRLKAPHGLRNPHGFDYELWLWEQGVQATGYVRTGAGRAAPQRIASTWRYPVEQLRQTVRDAIGARLLRGAPERADAGHGGDAGEDDGDGDGAAVGSANDSATRARIAGVIAALVTGDQRAIERQDWEVFRATGVAHLMSISGLHITLFAWLALRALRWLWRRSARLCLALPAQSAGLLGGVALAAGYALFSGWGVPAQRTVIMLASVAALQLCGRRWPWPQVWLLACAAVLLRDPWALAQPGFWLSFVAVGILFASNSMATNTANTGTSGVLAVVRAGSAMVREQWLLTLALTPLALLLFAQVSLVGFVANLLAIPWVTLLVTPLALAGLLWAPLWSLAALALAPLAALLQWFALWPWAVLYLPVAPPWAGAAALAAGALLALRLPWRLRLLALPLLLPALGWQAPRPAPGQFDLLAADVGQGGAVLVRTAGHSLLYDAGPRWGPESDAGTRVLVPLLRALGERLDLVLLSHRDADHTGGAAAVLAQQPQAGLAGSLEAAHPLQRLRRARPCLAGQRWQWDGVVFELLHPLTPVDGPERPARALRSSNAHSCVLRIQAATGAAASAAAAAAPAAALLTGDIEAAQEQALVARGAPLRANLLLVPHHGSKTSSSPALLEAVQPALALAQAGYRNRFGHPARAVVQRYRERSIALRDSATCGAAHWSSAQPAALVCERAAHRRYWQHRAAQAAD